jgi:hypothetical protein
VRGVPVQEHKKVDAVHDAVVDKKHSVTDEQKAVGALEDAKPKPKITPSNCVSIRFL